MPLDPTLKKARSAATALCLFAVVYVIVLLMGQGAGMPPLVIFAMLLITLTPFLAQWALSLVARQRETGRTVPVGLMLMLSLMMLVPTLFFGLGFLSRMSEALAAARGASAGATLVSTGLALLLSGLPAALSAWLALVFARLGAQARRAA